jgi:hypothetical protein
MKNLANTQRGQAMTEFVVAMLVAIPLFLGVLYIGKYEDIKYSAVQASRYAAFERAFDTLPSPHKSAATLADETRTRFFMDPMQKNQGAVAFNDAPPTNNIGKTLNQNWRGAAGENLIQAYSDIQAGVQKGANLKTSIATPAFGAEILLLKNVNDPGIQTARVQVPLANAKTFEPLAKLNLKLDVTTSMLVDGFNADGSNGGPGYSARNPAPNSVRGRVVAVWDKIPGMSTLESALSGNAIARFGWQALSDTPGPDIFCVTPDVVPTNALSGNTSYSPKTVCTQ